MNARTQPSRTSNEAEPRSRLARRLSVAAMFSLDPRKTDHSKSLRAAARTAAEALDRALPAGALALVTGPSGAGKSSVLIALARLARRRRIPVVPVRPASSFLHERRTPLDLLHGSLHDDIRLLSAAGLAEAPIWFRASRLLSEGQRSRLALAMALGAAHALCPRQPTIIADEFASTLDRVSAMTLCLGVRRMVQKSPACRLIVASAHDDLEQWLTPEIIVRIEPGFARHARFKLESRGDAA